MTVILLRLCARDPSLELLLLASKQSETNVIRLELHPYLFNQPHLHIPSRLLQIYQIAQKYNVLSPNVRMRF
jgi:hypothetical protein